jgi:lipopolysaccharide export system protein LptA
MPAVERGLRLTALLLLCLPGMAHGLASDRDQPMTIEADKATYKEKEGVSIYQGNVHLSQGTLKLHGDSLTVYMTNDHIDKAILTGNPATAVQRPDNADVDQHAEAQRIEYEAAAGLMTLTGDARVWQSDGRELRSDKIIYNITTNTVNAGSGTASERVHITLQPKPREQTPAAEPPPP